MNAETPRATKPIDKRTLSLADSVQSRIARGEELTVEDQAFINKLLKLLHKSGVNFSHIIGEQPTIAALTNQILALKKPQGKTLPDPDQQARNKDLLEEQARNKDLSEEYTKLRRELTAVQAENQGLRVALEEAEAAKGGVVELRDAFEKVSTELATARKDNQRLRGIVDGIEKDFQSLQAEVRKHENDAALKDSYEQFATALSPLVPALLNIAQEVNDKELAQKMIKLSEEIHSSLYIMYFNASAQDHMNGLVEARRLLKTRLFDNELDTVFPIQASNRLNAFGCMLANQIQPHLDEVDDPEATHIDFTCVNVHRRLDSSEQDNLRYYEIIELAFELKGEDNKTNFKFPFYMVYAPNHFLKTPCVAVAIPPEDLVGENSEGKKADLVLGQRNPWFAFDDGKPIEDADEGCEPHCNLEELPINRVPVSLDEAIQTLQEDVIEFMGEGGYLEVKLTREVHKVLNLDYDFPLSL